MVVAKRRLSSFLLPQITLLIAWSHMFPSFFFFGHCFQLRIESKTHAFAVSLSVYHKREKWHRWVEGQTESP